MTTSDDKINSFRMQEFSIADLWNAMKEGTLIKNPEFQRRNTWPQSAKSYLIDTILRGLPIPNIYVRTQTDTRTKKTYREVVDGQQRLRTIEEFMDGDLILDRQLPPPYVGKTFDELDEEDKSRFLAYPIGAYQLFDATDDLVLDIFQRLNAYGLTLNPQETRHGKYQGGKYEGVFRRAVIDASSKWRALWDDYKVVSVTQRVRMADHELMAQMLGILLEGVKDGGQPAINRLYETYDQNVPGDVLEQLDTTLRFMLENFRQILNTTLSRGPHFLMLFAAIAHALDGIPEGDMARPDRGMPQKDPAVLSNLSQAVDNLVVLEAIIRETDLENVPARLKSFKLATAGTTQRIRGRSIRFTTLFRALIPSEL